MKKRQIIYISLIAIFLLAFLWIQYFWISTSVELSKTEFDNRAKNALKEAIIEFEESFYCANFQGEIITGNRNVITLQNNTGDSLSNDTVSLYYHDVEKDSMIATNFLDLSIPAKIQIELNAQFLLDQIDDVGYSDYLKNHIGYYFSDTSSFNTFLFDSILTKHLKSLDIKEEYCFAISNSDSVVYSSRSDYNTDIIEKGISSVINVKGIESKSFMVSLYFPGNEGAVFGRLLVVMIGTIGVLVSLLIIFLIFFRNLQNEKKLLRMKSGFMSNMTHEFQTPVSNINLALDTIEKRNLNQENPHLINIIREENNRMKSNIDRVLQMTVMDNKQITYTKSQVDITDLIIKVIECFTIEINERNGKLFFAEDKEIGSINVDEVHFTNVLFNLIDNAIKYSKPDVAPEITIIAEHKNNKAVISVADNGIGISDADKKRLFDKFFRVQEGYQHDVKGFGLGLSYVYEVVKSHDGKIRVDSKPGKGSTFIIELP